MQTAEGKFEMDYDALIEQGTQAQQLLAQLLQTHCKLKKKTMYFTFLTYAKYNEIFIFLFV